uniref:Uncharacterized protein n=1 Tax=Glossina pallidipes TaxID=7398 RepID=A0A1A9ZWQ3_GLOPL
MFTILLNKQPLSTYRHVNVHFVCREVQKEQYKQNNELYGEKPTRVAKSVGNSARKGIGNSNSNSKSNRKGIGNSNSNRNSNSNSNDSIGNAYIHHISITIVAETSPAIATTIAIFYYLHSRSNKAKIITQEKSHYLLVYCAGATMK